MLLTSSDGASVELRPTRYQYTAAPSEPNLAFSVGAREGDSLVVRVHLSLESVADRPGAGEGAPTTSTAYSVPLRVGREELLAAAQAWGEDNRPFPER